MNCDTVQTIVGFLTAKDAARIAPTSKLFAKTVRSNICVVVEEAVCWGEATPDMTWDGQQNTGQDPCFRFHFVETKVNAQMLANKLKLTNKRTFLVRCGLQKDFSNLGWRNYRERRLSSNWFYVC